MGKKLTKELGLDQSVDTLGRWMAHYIAGLIQDAENADAEERPVKMQACYDAILKLWRHRSSFESGKRPLGDLEPLLRALESLDPEDDTPRYFRSIRAVAKDNGENEETRFWLKLIDDLDYSAKVLIRFCLAQAAGKALDKSMEWVSLAQEVGIDEGAEFPLIQAILKEIGTPDPNEEEQKLIMDRIERLEAFADRAKTAASKLRQRVRQEGRQR